jgi:SAM-dependent methyltransferase
MAAGDPTTSTAPILDAALKALDSARPHRGELLDLPCGSGYLSERARALGWQVQGADIAPDLWQGNSAWRPLAANLNEPLPFEAASFDAIACCEGWEHLENPWKALREFTRILKAEGTLVVSLPNTVDLRQRIRFFLRGHFGHYYPLVRGHINPLGPLALCHALLDSGFALKKVQSAGPYGGLLLRALAAIFPVPRKRIVPQDLHRQFYSSEILRSRTLIVVAQRLAG